MTAVTTLPRSRTAAPLLAEAIDMFLRRDDLEPGSRDTYAKTMTVLLDGLGNVPVDGITREQLDTLMRQRWGHVSAATFNRHRSAIGSLFTWCRAQDDEWIPRHPVRGITPRKLRRTSEQARRERAIPLEQLEQLWRLERVTVRDKLLWRMAYETWGRADELLGLNVEDLDLGRREALVHGKGGDIEEVWWSTGTARLLPRVIDGRTQGPLFLASKLPTRPMPAQDLDPTTGRARLSYRQAERILVAAGQRIDPTGAPWTLHRLRHAGIAHAVGDGMNLAQVRGKSRHASLRTLEVYANPSTDSLRAMTAALDREARRR